MVLASSTTAGKKAHLFLLLALLTSVPFKASEAAKANRKCDTARLAVFDGSPDKGDTTPLVAANTTVKDSFLKLVKLGVLDLDGNPKTGQQAARKDWDIARDREDLIKVVHALAKEGLFNPKNKLDLPKAIEAVKLLEQLQKLGIALPDPNAVVTVQSDGKSRRMRFSEAVKAVAGDWIGTAVSKPFVLVDMGVEFMGGKAAFTAEQIKSFKNTTSDVLFRPRTMWQNTMLASMAMMYPFVSPFRMMGSIRDVYNGFRWENWNWDPAKRKGPLTVKRGRIKSALFASWAVPRYFLRDVPWLVLYASLHASGTNPIYTAAAMLEEDELDEQAFDKEVGSPDDDSKKLTVMLDLNPNASAQERGSVAELGKVILRDEKNILYVPIRYPNELELVQKQIQEKFGRKPDQVFIYGENSEAGELIFPSKTVDAEYFRSRKSLGLVKPGGKIVIKVGRVGAESPESSGPDFMRALGGYLLSEGGTVVAPISALGGKQKQGTNWTFRGDKTHYGWGQGPITALKQIGQRSYRKVDSLIHPQQSIDQRIAEGAGIVKAKNIQTIEISK